MSIKINLCRSFSFLFSIASAIVQEALTEIQQVSSRVFMRFSSLATTFAPSRSLVFNSVVILGSVGGITALACWILRRNKPDYPTLRAELQTLYDKFRHAIELDKFHIISKGDHRRAQQLSSDLREARPLMDSEDVRKEVKRQAAYLEWM